MSVLKKILVTLMVVVLAFFPLTSTTNAADAIIYFKKEFILDVIARQVARALFNVAVNRLLEKIQTGINGAPALVQNWRNFQTLAQARGEDVFRVIVANSQLCGYVRSSINDAFRVTARYRVPLRGQTIRVRNMDPYTLVARCSMASGFDPRRFEQDFANNGGWGSFIQLLQPQNNFYGVYFQSLAELQKQRSLEENADLLEARTGYRSIRVGCEQPVNSESRCFFLGRVSTPADLVAKTAGLILDKNLEWLTNTDEISEVSQVITSFIWLYFENLAGAPGLQNNAAALEDQEKLEYCTSEKPERSVLNKYRSRFDPYGNAARGNAPCGTLEEDDLKKERAANYNICVQNCLRALGILPSEVPVPSLRGPTPSVRPSATPRPSTPPGGTIPPTSCQPLPNGCVLNTPENTCIRAEYSNAVNSAITQFINANPDVFEDPGSQSPIIKDGRVQEYMAGVVAIINAQGGGLVANVESGDEIAVQRSGGTFIEGYDIVTSNRQVRRAHVSTCPI